MLSTCSFASTWIVRLCCLQAHLLEHWSWDCVVHMFICQYIDHETVLSTGSFVSALIVRLCCPHVHLLVHGSWDCVVRRSICWSIDYGTVLSTCLFASTSIMRLCCPQAHLLVHWLWDCFVHRFICYAYYHTLYSRTVYAVMSYWKVWHCLCCRRHVYLHRRGVCRPSPTTCIGSDKWLTLTWRCPPVATIWCV